MTEPLELKKTVNLPRTNFAQKANLAQSEPARLKKWNDARLYAAIRESRRQRRNLFCTTVRHMPTPIFISVRRSTKS
jgi:hypothetical protein